MNRPASVLLVILACTSVAHGQLNPPIISGGGAHSLALRCDGTVWSWGRNLSDQLGLGSTNLSEPTPQQIAPALLSNVVAVAAGHNGDWLLAEDGHSLALLSDGTVRGWGSNAQGELGLGGSGYGSALPVPIFSAASQSGVVAIAAGQAHSLALTGDGLVWACGDNYWGQVGVGTTGGDVVVATQLPSLTGVVAIAVGSSHSLALKGDGTVWAWGNNSAGRLGLGTSGGSVATPQQIAPSTLSGIVAIAAGSAHNLALKDDGTIWVWGHNWFGQLGLGFNTCPQPPSSGTCFYATPQQIPTSTFSGVAAIAAGNDHSMALRPNGTLYSWGNNDLGQLGYPDLSPPFTFWPIPHQVMTGVVALECGDHHSLAVKNDGSVWAWGDNWAGQLGNGATTPINTPNYTPTQLTALTPCTFPLPSISSINPSAAPPGGGSFTLTVTGSNFVNLSKVLWDTQELPTTFVSATQLTAQVAAPNLASAGTAQIEVFNPPPGGGLSSALTFNIDNPVPLLTSLSPTQATAGGPGFVLTVNGSDFMIGADVRWNGSPRSTTFVNATQLTAQLTAADLATAGTAMVTVFNPAPGGGTSNSLGFTVGNPLPVLSTLSPSSAPVGSPDLPITVTGSSFVTASEVRWNGSGLVTTYVSATQLTTLAPAALLAAGGTAQVTVFNPPPMGGLSNNLTFDIGTSPPPLLTSITPSAIVAGAPAFNLYLAGNNFSPSSVVQWNGGALPTTHFGSERLVAAVSASLVGTPGTSVVRVVTPAPGGGTSSNLTFTIENPHPVLSGLSTAAIAAGSASTTINLNGFGFVPTSEARWDGTPVSTTYVSDTQLQAFLASPLFLSPGSFPITIVTPTPGGGTSNALAITVIGPRILAITPEWIDRLDSASPPFPVIVTGFAFPLGTVVHANGVALSTIWLSPAQLLVEIDPSIPQATMMGGIALTASTGPWIYSNTVALRVGAPTAVNQGTFAIVPPGAGPGDPVTILLEGVLPNTPLNFYGESGSPAPFYVPSPFDFVLQIFVPPNGTAIKFFDGIGTGFPTATPDLGGTPPGGTWALPLVLPNPPWGLQFNIQARYLDATHPVGYRLSWALAPVNL